MKSILTKIKAKLIPEDINVISTDDILEYMKNKTFIEFKGSKSNQPLIVNTNNKGRFIRLSLQIEVSFHLDCIEIYNKDGRNVAPNKNTIISSFYNDEKKYNGQGAITGSKNGGCGFHTKRERNPWLIIDLGTIRNLDKIVVYNREGIHGARAYSLMIETSTDLHNWKLIFDNWAYIKNYKNGNTTLEEKAFLYAGISEPAYAQKYLKSLKEHGETEKALEFLNTVNELVLDKGIALGPHGFMKTFELSSEDRKSKIYHELAELLKIMNQELETPTFISSGTLLGIVRDGQLIAHDDDVDICYISRSTSEKDILDERVRLFSALTDKGYKLSNSGLAHYWCVTPKGVSLDIFTGFIEENNCSMNPLKRNFIEQSNVLPLQKQTIHGVELYLPKNPSPLLELNYGPNWKIPDPLWSFNWSSAKKEYAFLY